MITYDYISVFKLLLQQNCSIFSPIQKIQENTILRSEININILNRVSEPRTETDRMIPSPGRQSAACIPTLLTQ